MNTKRAASISTKHNTETLSHAAAKSALLWGTLYSTAATGTIYAVAPNIEPEPLILSHVLAESMVMFYPFGAARGLLIQHLKNKRMISTGRDRRTVKWLNKRLPKNARSRAS